MKKLLGFFVFTLMIGIIVLTFGQGSESTYSIEDNIIPQANTNNDIPSMTSPSNDEDCDTDYSNDFDVYISDVQDGVVSVNINIDTNKVLKVKSSLGDNKTYYDVDSSRALKIPLQMGDGTYEISVFINKSGSDYIKLYSKEVEMHASANNAAFLNSNQVVNFENSSATKEITDKLTDGKSSSQAIHEIYEYVVKNFEYDYNKAETLSSNYVPNVDNVLQSKTGICYDYAAVTASMLRSAGIPTKLTMGYRSDTNVYHAWNEVLIDGEWMIIDTTWDSVQLSNGARTNMIKDSSLYSAEQQF